MNKVNKILGIDFGSLTMGLAIYDESVDFIYPLKTLKRNRENILRENLRELVDIINKENIYKIIVGLPLSMNGNFNERTELTNNFIKKLKSRLIDNIDIILQDERLTTEESKEILYNNNVKKELHKQSIDQVAACLILKDYRENIKNGK